MLHGLKPLWADVNKHLLASLNDVKGQENESLWLDEAGRRYEAYKPEKAVETRRHGEHRGIKRF